MKLKTLIWITVLILLMSAFMLFASALVYASVLDYQNETMSAIMIISAITVEISTVVLIMLAIFNGNIRKS
ncbi:membrane protein YqaA with SNARE-associated domain [Dysgonomonadaceae bacterium PH5-43]|nr:membrane protein YqaA with SNARE-associated domain [Dysgonomonadaceae bacterium PH5-43]